MLAGIIASIKKVLAFLGPCGTWNIGTSTNTSNSIDLTSLGGIPTTLQGLEIANSGTKLYAQSANTIYEYTLSTAYDITSATYSSNTLDTSGQAGTVYEIRLGDNGTKLYILETLNDSVYQYTLSTPYDLSSGAYANKSKAIGTQETTPKAFAISTDGDKMYMYGNISDSIHQYTLSTAWDISTATYDNKSFSVNFLDAGGVAIDFSLDGTKCYYTGEVNDTLYQLDLGTAWDISTAVYNSVLYDYESEIVGNPGGLKLARNGEHWYVATEARIVYQYSLGYTNDTALAQASYDGKSVSVSDTNPSDVQFNSTGSKMYVAGASTGFIYQYALGTLWDVSTASFSFSKNVNNEDAFPTGVYFNDTGTKMYVIGATDAVYQYTLSTPDDVNTAVYDSVVKDVSSLDNNMRGVTFSSNGAEMYVIGLTSDTVYQLTLSAPWDISTAVYGGKLKTVGSESATPTGVTFNADGSGMYISEFGAPAIIYQYSLSVAWDISTAIYNGVLLDVESEGSGLSGIAFKPDASKLYTIGFTTDTVYQYSIPTCPPT